MNNRAQYLFAAVIALCVVLDMRFNDARIGIFLARKFLDLITVVAFWR